MAPKRHKPQPLAEIRARRFAELIAQGKDGRHAYRGAGFNPKSDASADAGASALLRHSKVKAHLAELTGFAAEKTKATIEKVATEFARIAFADIRKVVSWRPENIITEENGCQVIQSRVTVLDSALLDPDIAAAISEVSQGANGALRIKMHSKTEALKNLGLMLGAYRGDLPAGDFDRLSNQELISQLSRHANEMGIKMKLTYDIDGSDEN